MLIRFSPYSYTEIIDQLYAHNTFLFSDTYSLRHFFNATLPHRLALIQNVEIGWSEFHFLNDTDTSLIDPSRVIVSRMRGLKLLRILIVPFHDQERRFNNRIGG